MTKIRTKRDSASELEKIKKMVSRVASRCTLALSSTNILSVIYIKFVSAGQVAFHYIVILQGNNLMEACALFTQLAGR
jgi:hypothetical protein